MKRFWLLTTVLVLAAAPSAASSFGFGVAYLDTEGAADDNGAAVRLSLDAGERWNLDLRASFFDGHGFVLGPRTFDIEATPIDLGLSYGFNTGGKATVYVGGGVSYTLFKSELFNVARGEREQSRIENEPGWYALVGVERPFQNHIGFFLEAVYRQNKPTLEGDGLAEFGSVAVDFAGAGAMVGLFYGW